MSPILCFIDDETEILQTYQEFFSNQFDVRCYSHPADFLRDLQNGSCQPDAIVTDFKMPGIPGIELIRKIREKKIEIPVLLLSGYVEKDVALDAVDLGTYAILEKPVPIEKLHYVVERMMIEVRLSLLQKEVRHTILQLKEIYASLHDALMPLIPPEILDRFFVEELSANQKRNLSIDEVLKKLEKKLDELFESESNLINLKTKLRKC